MLSSKRDIRKRKVGQVCPFNKPSSDPLAPQPPTAPSPVCSFPQMTIFYGHFQAILGLFTRLVFLVLANPTAPPKQ